MFRIRTLCRLLALVGSLAFVAVFTASATRTGPGSPSAANEAAAIAMLRTIAKAQSHVQRSGDIDTDDDRVGEYGYLAELAGRRPVRVSIAGVPAAGVMGVDELYPPLIPAHFGSVHESTAVSSGYRFQLWLPSATHPWNFVYGMAEDWNGGKQAAPFPDPRNGASYWCCYAWPTEVGVSGQRAFFVNQKGIVLECANDGATPYTGDVKRPDFAEAYAGRSMSLRMRVGLIGGLDGTTWTVAP